MTTKINTPLASITGKGKTARIAAFNSLASQAYNAEDSKARYVAGLTLALGDTPSPEQTALARLETIVGVAAMRMPANELPKTCKSEADRIAHVRDLVMNYQAPSTSVAGKVRKLNKGKSGWRSAVQNRIIRNAEDRASKYLAEVGAGAAKTEAAKSADAAKAKETRAPQMAGSSNKSADATPSHSVLVKPDKPVDAAAYVQHMQTALAQLLAYDNANAKVRPVTHGEFAEHLVALRTLGNKAANAFAALRVETDGKAAVAGK